jgi:hypothetical protein
MMPISPRHLFVATNNINMENQLRQSFSDGVLSDHINHVVVAQAAKYVYGVDSSMVPFVEQRLGKYPPQFIAQGAQQISRP